MPARTHLKQSIATLGVIAQKHVFYMHNNGKEWPPFFAVVGYFNQLISSRNPATDPVWLEVVTVDGQEGGVFTNACLERFAQDFGFTFEVVTPSAS